MGLIRQIDDWLGRLFDHLKKLVESFDDTLIFFTADHGDFLGDHWLGEKEMFYEEALRVPLIVYDPDPRDFDAVLSMIASSRPSTSPAPTCLAALAQPQMIIPSKAARCCHSCAAKEPETWRDAVFSELDDLFLRGAAAAEARAARLPSDHGADRPLEIRLVAGFPSDAVRSRQRPEGVA